MCRLVQDHVAVAQAQVVQQPVIDGDGLRVAGDPCHVVGEHRNRAQLHQRARRFGAGLDGHAQPCQILARRRALWQTHHQAGRGVGTGGGTGGHERVIRGQTADEQIDRADLKGREQVGFRARPPLDIGAELARLLVDQLDFDTGRLAVRKVGPRRVADHADPQAGRLHARQRPGGIARQTAADQQHHHHQQYAVSQRVPQQAGRSVVPPRWAHAVR